MVVLEKPSGDQVLIFGRGLIGSALESELVDRGLSRQLFPFHWQQSTDHAAQLDSIRARLGDLKSPRAKEVVVIWSAGAAGFSCDQAEANAELESFAVVLAFARSLQSTVMSVRFVMVRLG